MRKKFQPIIVLVLLLAITFLAFQPVFAQGPFDMTCPECHGTGKVSCSTCQGTGKVTATVQCSTCQGTGQIQPTISLKSMNGWGALSGLDWVARVQGVFHNEEDKGTYGVATSEVHTVTTTYYHSSPRTYFTPHEDVTITIDTPEVGFLTDWTYTISLSSLDKITCPDCNGSGTKSTLTTCSVCNGLGKVTCSRCDGRGYVTNQTAVNLAIVGVAVVIIGSVLGATVFALSRRKRQEQAK